MFKDIVVRFDTKFDLADDNKMLIGWDKKDKEIFATATQIDFIQFIHSEIEALFRKILPEEKNKNIGMWNDGYMSAHSQFIQNAKKLGINI